MKYRSTITSSIMMLSALFIQGCGIQPTSAAVVENLTCTSLAVAPSELFNVDLVISGTRVGGVWTDATCKLVDHDEGDTIFEVSGTDGCSLPYNLSGVGILGNFSIELSSEAEFAYTSNTVGRAGQISEAICE